MSEMSATRTRHPDWDADECRAVDKAQAYIEKLALTASVARDVMRRAQREANGSPHDQAEADRAYQRYLAASEWLLIARKDRQRLYALAANHARKARKEAR